MAGLRLVLARHGQTEANVRMALDTALPGPPLTELGRKQAAELGDSLAGEPVTAVYASTAVRARETAEPVAARHGLAVTTLDGLQEVNVGELEGRTDEQSLREFFTVFTAWAGGDTEVSMPGGETGAEVIARYHAAIADISARHSHGVVVVVSHGGVIRLVAPTLATNVELTVTQHALLPNTGRVVLDHDPSAASGWRCSEWTGLDVR